MSWRLRVGRATAQMAFGTLVAGGGEASLEAADPFDVSWDPAGGVPVPVKTWVNAASDRLSEGRRWSVVADFR